MIDICCEPLVEPDGGFGDCEPAHSCETAIPGCGSDLTHYELGGCEWYEVCCD